MRYSARFRDFPREMDVVIRLAEKTPRFTIMEKDSDSGSEPSSALIEQRRASLTE